jgi:regulatory protein YycI of two-component signal transduction system YycFG
LEKYFICFIYIFLIIILSACNSGQSDDTLTEVGLAEYIKSTKMPERLSVGFNPQDVKETASVRLYEAEWLKIDIKTAAEGLLHSAVTSEGMYATGPYVEAAGEEWVEYLQTHDRVLPSGLNYVRYEKEFEGKSLRARLDTVIEISEGYPSRIAQVYGYGLKTDYVKNEDLSFMPYKDAITNIEKKLTIIGFPEITAHETYALDMATMLEHYRLYANLMETESGALYEWIERDECYFVNFRQIIDSIPITNIIWEEGTRKGWDPTETPIYAVYSTDGIISLYAYGLYRIKDDKGDKPLISAASAFKALLSEYEKIILMSEHKVLSMELNYIGMHQENSLLLIPAWVFAVSRPDTMGREDTDKNVFEYLYIVINALTGERIRTAVDNK